MKNKLRLHNNIMRRGASALIAILVFFLAALSGTVALTMSASNAGRYAHERDDQQAYLYCASAARMILSRLEDLDVVFESTEKSAPVTSDEVEVKLCKSTKDSDGKVTKREELNDANKSMFLKDDNFISMLTDYAMNVVMTPVEFCLYLDNDQSHKVYVTIQRLGSNFNFDFWVGKGSSRAYQMSMSQILGAWDDSLGVGGDARNFQQYNGDDDAQLSLFNGYYYKILQFNVKDASFIVGNLKGDNTTGSNELKAA